MSAPSSRLEIHVPGATILRLLVTALSVWCFIKLWPELVFLFLSLILAIAIEPTVVFAERKGVPRGVAVLGLAIGLFGIATAIAVLAIPPVVVQLLALIEQLPLYRDRVLANLSRESGFGRMLVEQFSSLPSAHDVAPYMTQTLLVGVTTLSGLATTFLVGVTTLYFLLDGKRLYAWLLAYVPRSHRPRVAETVPEVSQVVTGYVRGQLVTSALFGAFAAVLLHFCHVPAVLPLAIFAAVCDVVPMVGIVIAIVPAALLGLTVSPATAVVVFVGYLAYHQIEAYIIVPRVYGSTLRISTLAVLLALLVGATLQGMLGAILILPIVAAYPIIERIWLKDYLAPEVLHDHMALERAADTGDEAAVQSVLQGVEHERIES
jgi:predicted PurR-regulated permease PerM